MRLGDVGPHQRNVFERDKSLAELGVEIDETAIREATGSRFAREP